MKKIFPITIFLLAICFTLVAQEADRRFSSGQKTLSVAVIEEIDSKELSEKRTLNIYLPFGYDPDSATTYPVIYLLDGSAHEDLLHIIGLVQFMNLYELLPKSIVVGIANVDRYRDFSHVTNEKKDLKALPTGGGSEKFMNFVEKELQPFIKSHYLTTENSTLIGQSMGGLLATEVLLKRPHMFEQYIIVSPSLWWDNQSMVNDAAKYLAKYPTMKKKIFVSLGKEHKTMHKVADKLTEAIKESGSKNITLFYEPILTEDHATILHRAVYRAFEVLGK